MRFAAAVGLALIVALGCASPEEIEKMRLEREAREQREEAERKAAETAAWDALPTAERKFCEVLTEHAKLYAEADNDLKRSAVRLARSKALVAAVPGGKIQKWSAVVKTLTTTSQGNAVLEMTLPCSDFGIGTTNNELSDALYETLIPIGSPAFATLSEMKAGSGIWFNGRLISDLERLDGWAEISLTERGSMTGGYFLMRF